MIPPVELIALVGERHVGKDTFYALALELHLERRIKYRPKRISFGDHIKRALAKEKGLKESEVFTKKEFYRPELQKLGEDSERWNEEVRKEMMALKIKEPTLLIVTDVRYLSNAKFLRELGCRLIKIRRNREIEPSTHISEIEPRLIPCDNFIDNNASERLFKMQILDLLKQLNIT